MLSHDNTCYEAHRVLPISSWIWGSTYMGLLLSNRAKLSALETRHHDFLLEANVSVSPCPIFNFSSDWCLLGRARIRNEGVNACTLLSQ